MQVITQFRNIENYPLKVELFGTLGEFQKLTKHIDKSWAEPMASLMYAIEESVKKATQSISEETK